MPIAIESALLTEASFAVGSGAEAGQGAESKGLLSAQPTGNILPPPRFREHHRGGGRKERGRGKGVGCVEDCLWVGCSCGPLNSAALVTHVETREIEPTGI